MVLHDRWGGPLLSSHLLVAKEARCAEVLPGCASSSCVLAGISL